MKNTDASPSTSRLLSALIFLTLATIGCFTVFITNFWALLNGLDQHLPVIKFDQGIMGFLGGGIGLLLFFFLILLRNKISKSAQSILMAGAIAGIFIMFIFPHIMGAVVDDFVEHNHYIYCKDVSYHSGRYNSYVYTHDKETCVLLVEKAREEDE